jgi:hypothetical protein
MIDAHARHGLPAVSLDGVPLVASEFVPDFTLEPVPARNKREARKRAIVARRRRRAGKPRPQYLRKSYGVTILLNGTLYASPRTVAAIAKQYGGRS